MGDVPDLLKAETTIIGVPYHRPMFTALDKCHYDACMEISENFQLEGKVNTKDIREESMPFVVPREQP